MESPLLQVVNHVLQLLVLVHGPDVKTVIVVYVAHGHDEEAVRGDARLDAWRQLKIKNFGGNGLAGQEIGVAVRALRLPSDNIEGFAVAGFFAAVKYLAGEDGAEVHLGLGLLGLGPELEEAGDGHGGQNAQDENEKEAEDQDDRQRGQAPALGRERLQGRG